MQSIEDGVPVPICTNNGVTATCDGEVYNLSETTFEVVVTIPATATVLYTRFGKLFTKLGVVLKSYFVNSMSYENERKSLLKNISRKLNVLQLTFQLGDGRAAKGPNRFGALPPAP